MTHHRIARIATLSLAIAAVAAPTAAARADNTRLRTPDANVVTTATATQQAGETQDFVSPDARDAATRTSTNTGTAGETDARSPDARDVADGRGAWTVPPVTVVRVSEPAPSSSGLDWADAGIGAGAVVGLMLLALGGALAVVHRRHDGPEPERSAPVV
jgi:hypothetical protein